ncbi:MAG: chromate transporter [Longibaculum muris]|uniref:Chromate transporter n=1 Tax=Longibaculum muris TaxID=1796628 RepID=A0A4R3Z6Y1_9FIRM|nr:chromate transporter [Longibaculum muris]KXU45359.1 chromate transport protein [Candidatus Stoquefichus sp. KLE1796]MBS5368239.1 chromate transporter [Coprobacillus cateniformis]MCR1886640.1 chromate transporter [Longibaculum muris]MED9813115.1 chromate transporter [Longibaculum muris]TCW01694.1 chromate transporter [Longibaculum muris]
MIYIQLFISFLQIGLFSFGGGYAAMPLIQNQVVNLHHWLSLSEFTDLITISQMTPGPIAINSATFVGEKIAGVPGAIVATLGCIMPSIIIVTIIAYFYMKYRDLDSLQSVLKTLRPAVVAMIASAGVSILVTAFFGESGLIVMKNLKIQMVVIFVICMVLLMKFKMSPVFVMILAGILNVMQYFLLSSLSLGTL